VRNAAGGVVILALIEGVMMLVNKAILKAQMAQDTAVAVAKINAEAVVMRAQLQASATPATATTLIGVAGISGIRMLSGGEAWPAELSPQQATRPASVTSQTCCHIIEIDETLGRPAGTVDCPTPLSPQHRTSPEAVRTQVLLNPASTCTSGASGSGTEI
jgi:hypothetical protein